MEPAAPCSSLLVSQKLRSLQVSKWAPRSTTYSLDTALRHSRTTTTTGSSSSSTTVNPHRLSQTSETTLVQISATCIHVSGTGRMASSSGAPKAIRFYMHVVVAISVASRFHPATQRQPSLLAQPTTQILAQLHWTCLPVDTFGTRRAPTT